MQNTDPKDKSKLKESLMRSGLPLEHCVTEILDRKRLTIHGEYIYARQNEGGVESDHSVDLKATYNFHGRKHGFKDCNITFLLECKYANPAIRWLFLPYATNSSIGRGLIQSFDLLCSYRLRSLDPIQKIEQQWEYCLKGTAIDTTNNNSQRIERGLSQLRWALPHIAVDLMTRQAFHSVDEDVIPQFICPILVTNAPIFVINKGLSLSDFLQAEDVSTIAAEVPGVICFQEPGPQLNSFIAEKMITLYRSNRMVHDRINGIWKVTASENHRKEFDPTFNYMLSYQALTNSVLVLNLASLDEQIDNIIAAVRKTSSKRKQIVHLEHVLGTLNSRVVPVPSR